MELETITPAQPNATPSPTQDSPADPTSITENKDLASKSPGQTDSGAKLSAAKKPNEAHSLQVSEERDGAQGAASSTLKLQNSAPAPSEPLIESSSDQKIDHQIGESK